MERVPAGSDKVHIHHPRYYSLHAYPFSVGYSFPLLTLVEEFCHYYNVSPTQLAPYVYKVIKMLSKFAELVGVEVTVRHLVYIFPSHFYQGTMLNLRHRGKYLIVKMDDKGIWKFWLDYFFIKTEVVIADVIGFTLAWNHTRKYYCFRFNPFKYFVHPELVE